MKNQIYMKAVAVSLCLLSAAAHAQSKFSLTNLSSLSPQGDAVWNSINNAGDIVGTDGYNVNVYSNGALKQYEVGYYSWDASAFIGNDGTVAYTVWGNYQNLEMDRSYVLKNGVIQEIKPLYPDIYRGGTYARAMNDSGVVVGSGSHYNSECSSSDWGCEYRSPWSRAIIYQNGQTTDLGTLGGNTASAHGINNQGVIVGVSTTSPDADKNTVFVYTDGAMRSLDITANGAVFINDAAQIAGKEWGPNGNEAWLYDHGKVTALGLTDRSNVVLDMNNAGQVVGSGDNLRFWLYAGGETIDLNTLLHEDGWWIDSVLDLNDRGQILATARRNGGALQYVLLTPDQAPILLPPGVPPGVPLPVPEPGTYAMLIGGLGVLAAWRRRRTA
ncbi:PEP-CTERM sorting domain-containing protein [Pseudoduganella plicata]|uniref:PEP-CTERM sorting domain-containing protein n=1 Tax=Pseudoduganella plicata TaxID=321984 RepID=A0A4P7BIT9_9BURK|nr:PEP-CTERM sorting domain-containing protein [Pseudoduganella plicata]QBQ37429.1 PEP-CTERM sorting domain-containing protein [Pseudoduganella plicata]GGY90106.1 hypothetical protein GCM10007388_24180 [Pseudoduganella plicata]